MSPRAGGPSLKRPPVDRTRLAGFPEEALSEKTLVWRVTKRAHGPWWFNSDLTQRFDLPQPHGTCYLAFDAVTAFLEALGPDRDIAAAGTIVVSDRFVAERRLRRLTLPHPFVAAHLASRRAAPYGVTLEISTIIPYDMSQEWASALREAGFDALIYRARHDPGAATALALLGRTGERTSWNKGTAHQIAGELLDELGQELDLRVEPVPRLDQLETI